MNRDQLYYPTIHWKKKIFLKENTYSSLGFLLLLGDVCGGAFPLQLQVSERHTKQTSTTTY